MKERTKGHKRGQEQTIALRDVSQEISKDRKYRVSGHESFPCRYAWLPKAMNHPLASVLESCSAALMYGAKSNSDALGENGGVGK